jgi:hypothetical protein
VAQASSSWQQLVSQILNWMLPVFKTVTTKQRNIQRYREPGGVLSFLTIVVAMLLWNPKLLFASSIGIGAMVSAYSMQKWNWQKYWSELSQFFHQENRRLVVAVLSGGIATLSSYIAASVWVGSQNPWIATGAILQGVGTLLILILLVWLITNINDNQQENHLDQLIVNLTESDPLKRKVAIRQLTKLVKSSDIDTSERQNVAECLQLLLTQEEESLIRDAAFDCLQALQSQQMHDLRSVTPLKPLTVKLKQVSRE